MNLALLYSDYVYLLLVLVPIMILAGIAQAKVKSTFKQYSTIASRRGLTGAQAAQTVLDYNGVSGVRFEHVDGELTDHYDPKSNVIRLSDPVFNSTGIAAIGVAAHEAGHAVQYAQNYSFVKLRMSMIPVCKIGSNLAWPLLFIGLLFNFAGLYILGIIMFSLSTLFQLVTLPVEFNASSRALKSLSDSGTLDGDELQGAKKVLWSAAMTYVAALAVSIVQLLRFILIALSRGNKS